MFSWSKDSKSKKPFYRQLSDHIIRMIRSGELKAGTKLPSERTVSDTFSVSRNTVSAAFDYLQDNGFISRISRSGAVVTDEAWRNAAPGITPNWKRFENKGHGQTDNSYITAGTARKSIPHLTRRHVYGELNFAEYFFSRTKTEELELHKISNDDSTDWRGIYPLRESLSHHMARMGVNAKPEQILICTSITQALNTIANIFLNVGMTYYHECSSFINLKSIMRSSGAHFEGLELDENGIVIDKLKQRIRPVKNSFLHLHANNHNPTGITTSMERRKEIMALCSKHGIPIVEMDSMRGMYYLKEDPPPVKSLDINGSVIYIGSFLRPSSEMMGLAWIVADEYLVNCIAKLKQPMDTYPNLIAQLIADTVLRNGMFYEYLSALRGHLSAQMQHLNVAMQCHIGDVAQWDTKRSSYYIWPEFDKGINIKSLYSARTDIDFNPGFFYDKNDNSHISVTTLSMNADSFNEAFKRLRALINKISKNQ